MNEAPADARYPWLDKALDDDGAVITANQRLARALTAAWSETQLRDGRNTWLTPKIYPWNGWLARLMAAVSDPSAVPRRLDAASATILWERCLSKRLPDGVLGINGVVRQAQSSWSRLNEWNVGIPALLSTAASQDEKLFAGAAADYLDLLETGNWTDASGTASHVAAAIKEGVIDLPPRVTLAGFDRLSPVTNIVLQAVSAAGCQVITLDSPQPEAPAEIAEFDNDSAELRAAGAWARQIIEGKPDARVAIVYPGLETGAEHALRCIRDGLLPGWQMTGRAHCTAVEISYGRPLAEYPAVATALTLLRWTSRGLSGAEISPLILSPFFRADTAGVRERLELAFREFPDREWTPRDFRKILGITSTGSEAQTFTSILSTIAEVAENADGQFPPAECIRLVDELLEHCGWPGEKSLDSETFQLINRWRELLNEFARVEAVMPILKLSQAIRRIERLAADALWQPETSPGVVQVLGPLEAAGMAFDAIWVAGMDASNWPPPSRPAPFICAGAAAATANAGRNPGRYPRICPSNAAPPYRIRASMRSRLEQGTQ